MGVYTNALGEEVFGFDPLVAGTYGFTLTVTNEFDCVAACDFEIVVNPLPYLELELSADVICLGETIDGIITGPEDGAYPYVVEYLLNSEPMVDEVYGPNTVLPLTPEFAGLYILELLTIVDANGCVSVSNQVLELNVLPLTEITLQPVSLEVSYGASAEFSVEADNATGYQWYFNDVAIEGATDASFAIEAVVVADDGDYYCVVTGDCNEVQSDVVTLTVLPLTQVIDFLGSINGMSTYLDLINKDLATIVSPVVAHIGVVDFRNPDVIWTPLNSSFDISEAQGAKVTLGGGFPTSIEVQGWPTLGTEVNLLEGNNYIPIWSEDVVLAADVFGPLGADLYAVFSLDYSGFYWPIYNLYTLEYLTPGSSYLVIMMADAVASFAVPAVDATPMYVDLPKNITNWDNATLTGTQHNIAITSNALAQMEIGDVIGAFNEYGQMAGMVEITSLRDNTVLRTYGDNYATQKAEGFVEGDLMTIKVWRNGEEMVAQATYAADAPNQNVFTNDGASAITNLKLGATSINDLTADMNASLYPNPATDLVNIKTNFAISNIKVVNYVGQVVFNQNVNQMNFQINTSNYGSGMYFVQITNTEGVVITKRLTVK